MVQGDLFSARYYSIYYYSAFGTIQLSWLFYEGSIAELILCCTLSRFHPTFVLREQFLTMSWNFHYRQQFSCTRCHLYPMLLHEYCLPRFVLCDTFRFHEMSSSQCYVHRNVALLSYALVQAPQEI